MPIVPSKHAKQRMAQRGATQDEVEETVVMGVQSQNSKGQDVFQKSFDFCRYYMGKYYTLKHVKVIAVFEHPDWVVVTVIVKYSN
jgi:hypothetical protein